MKQIIRLFVFLLCGLIICHVSHAAFVTGLEDIPLAEGFSQVEEGWSFGNEESRMIEVYLTSKTKSFQNAADFYQKTLPQMGWQLKKAEPEKVFFERDGETLEIDSESSRPLRVRLTVKSKN